MPKSTPSIASRLKGRLGGVRRRHGVAEYRLVRGLGRRLGYDVVRANFYSPVSDVSRLPPSTWDEPAAMPGLELDLEAQLRTLTAELSEYLREFSPPRDAPGDEAGFFLSNPHYGPTDAQLLYAMVRRFRPRRVLELGSGYSTLVIATASARNASEGQPMEHRVYDPFPSTVLTRVRDRIELHATSAAEIELETFAALEPDDVLFIDTTHTLRPGSEVLYLLLNALPALQPGVVVHIHDIYRPFEYPRALYDVFGAYWQEHYLLQAFLAFNAEFEVLCATHALARLRPEQLRTLAPNGAAAAASPSSFWIRRRDSDA